MKPGYMPTSSTQHVNYPMFMRMIQFCDPDGRCVDVGPKNVKIEMLKKHYNIYIEQIESKDFNFWVPLPNKYNTIFCFEMIEHLQNPLLFMKGLKDILDDYGTIYLSTPGRPRIIWNKHHFFEMTPDHINKWIFEPLGLYVYRMDRIRICRKWYRYIGFRPFIRLLTSFTNIYEIKKKPQIKGEMQPSGLY